MSYALNPSRPAIQPDRSRYNPIQKVKVKVVGAHDVDGHEPGDVVEIEVTQGQLDVLLQAGHVEVVEEAAGEQAPSVEEAASTEAASVDKKQAVGEALPAETVEE